MSTSSAERRIRVVVVKPGLGGKTGTPTEEIVEFIGRRVRRSREAA